jgi:hypothetical protein
VADEHDALPHREAPQGGRGRGRTRRRCREAAGAEVVDAERPDMGDAARGSGRAQRLTT